MNREDNYEVAAMVFIGCLVVHSEFERIHGIVEGLLDHRVLHQEISAGSKYYL